MGLHHQPSSIKVLIWFEEHCICHVSHVEAGMPRALVNCYTKQRESHIQMILIASDQKFCDATSQKYLTVRNMQNETKNRTCGTVLMVTFQMGESGAYTFTRSSHSFHVTSPREAHCTVRSSVYSSSDSSIVFLQNSSYS